MWVIEVWCAHRFLMTTEFNWKEFNLVFTRALFFTCMVLPAFAQIQIQAPSSVPAGSEIEITWSEGGDPRDFITIVLKDREEGQYDNYKYAQIKTWRTAVPEVPGEYEIRYLAAKSPYATLARQVLVVTAVTASLSVPAEVDAGSSFDIQWEGPGNPRDFITVVEAGTPAQKYGKYVYTRRGNPVAFKAPETPGDYEVRYLTGTKYFTLAAEPLRVKGVNASVQIPDSIGAGALLEVNWTGPGNDGDFITIVAAGAEEGTYGKYTYTRKGNPLQIRVPEEAGDYEVRYLTASQYKTLASAAIKVGSVSADLVVPDSVAAGSDLDIQWTGPGNRHDYLTIVPVDAPEGTYKKYKYVSLGNPITMSAPDEPGQYEVRYLTGSKYYTLARAKFSVAAVTASLDAPAEAEAGGVVDIGWDGPGNRNDFIAIAPLGSDDRTWPAYRYTQMGNPVALRLPLTPGEYELRYQTGSQYRVLARRAIRLTPPQSAPGFLKVVLAGKDPSIPVVPENAGVVLILDASGSMLQRMEGKRRIEVAKEVLVDLIRNKMPAGTPMALRVFGHREADACRTDLEIPLGPLNPQNAAGQIAKIQAMNLAKTPIAQSLSLVAQDLQKVKGQRIVVLITDGEETCGGDPAEAIRELQAAGIDVRVNIVGFAIDDAALSQTFKLWAEMGRGSYFNADNAAGLGESLARAMQIPFEVLDDKGQVVATGLVGGDPVEVPAGTYGVRTREVPPRSVQDAAVQSSKTQTVTIR